MDINDFEKYKSYEEQPCTDDTRWDYFSKEDKKRAKSRFSRYFAAVAAFLLISNLVAIITEVVLIFALGAERAAAIADNYIYIWTMNVVAMYVVAFPIFLLIVRPMSNTVRSKRKLTVKEFFELLFVSFAFMFIGSTVGTYINSFVSKLLGRESVDLTSDLIISSPWWLILIVAVVIGPIIEEVMFRKLLMDKLGMYGDRIAIVISAVAFGIFHGNISQICYATLVGLILAYIYSKTSKITYCIGLHMLLNFFGSIVPIALLEPMDRYYEILDVIANGGQYDTMEFEKLSIIVGAYSSAVLVIVALGVYILFKKIRNVFVSDRCEISIPRHKRFGIILLNSGAFLFIILTLATILLNIFSAPLIEESINSDSILLNIGSIYERCNF